MKSIAAARAELNAWTDDRTRQESPSVALIYVLRALNDTYDRIEKLERKVKALKRKKG